MRESVKFVILRLMIALFTVLAVGNFLPSATAAADGVLLTGMVKSAQGETMAGVTVSARAVDSTITTSVYTDKDGNFYFPRLAEGKYRVWAQAVKYEAAKTQVELAGSVQHENFALKTIPDFTMQLTGDQWMASLPVATKEDLRMKELIRINCVGCHSQSFIFQNRFDEKGWKAILTLMSRQLGPGRPPLNLDQAPMPAVNYFKSELAAYLAKLRGPIPFPMNFKVRSRPTGDSALVVITEYAITLPEGGFPDHDGSDWSFGTPGKVADSHDAQIDFNGNLWFTDWTPNIVRTFGKIDARTGETKNFLIPGARGFAALTHAMIRDASGILWFNVKLDNVKDGSRLGRIDPNTEKIELFSPPSNMPTVGDFLDWDGLGNIWMAAGQGNTREGLLRFDPNMKTFSYFKAPFGEGSETGHNGLYGVAADSRGNGWYSLFSADKEGRADLETGAVTAIDIPKRRDLGLFTQNEKEVFKLEGAASFDWAQPWTQGPRRPGADKHGDFLWVPGWWGHTLTKIDTRTSKVVAQYPMPRLDAGPYMAQVDKDHMVWVNYQNSGTISKFDPSAEKWTEYYLPSQGFETREIGIDDHNGPTQIALADERGGKLARLQFRTQADMNALKSEVEEESRSTTATK